MGVFMKTQLNPPFSKLSFLLFHESEGEMDLAALPASANELLAAAVRLGQWAQPPGESPEGRQVFFEYAASLRNDAANLVKAVNANKRDVAAKIFEDLRGRCDSCHHFFRYEEAANLHAAPILIAWGADGR